MPAVRSSRHQHSQETVSPLAAVTLSAEDVRSTRATLIAVVKKTLGIEDASEPRSDVDALAAKVGVIKAIGLSNTKFSLKTKAMKTAFLLAMLANQEDDFPTFPEDAEVEGFMQECRDAIFPGFRPGTYNGKPHEPMEEDNFERLERGEDREAQKEYDREVRRSVGGHHGRSLAHAESILMWSNKQLYLARKDLSALREKCAQLTDQLNMANRVIEIKQAHIAASQTPNTVHPAAQQDQPQHIDPLIYHGSNIQELDGRSVHVDRARRGLAGAHPHTASMDIRNTGIDSSSQPIRIQPSFGSTSTALHPSTSISNQEHQQPLGFGLDSLWPRGIPEANGTTPGDEDMWPEWNETFERLMDQIPDLQDEEFEGILSS
ncbi:hypothetical protein DACRYDRAFT_110127 [Dacryopinax primogenitus]|uniref:Uncharacterized protein n=1 Tax=Dacryopinax primogenitus (strain DJM 731) TaxID=1858805 RepID=M5FV11_DACPD|nr:uncharacterized protein DACRYDRAFT_110127 [Dacryopinax primogenitus]EJT99404.1 hypothetical protein DACRYDRAFT_110127 [Dacryopinax primogenitus]